MASPALAARTAPLRESVFAILARRLVGYSGKRYPFHIGDNIIAPPEGAQWGHIDLARFGPPYRYGHPNGEEALRTGLAEKLRSQNGLDVGPDNVLISVGATHGITCVLEALIDPGDEILLLSPYWPLVRGVAHCAGVVPVEAPFYQHLLDHPDADIAALIEPFITPRTRILYLINPNNPNGLVLTRQQLVALGQVAEAHGLWLLSDEAYEHYSFVRPHVSPAALPGLAERTITTFTFSKSYAMAGTRVGYVVGPGPAISAMRKVATHSVYNTAQVCQAAALGALESGPAFLELAKATYAAHGQLVAEKLPGWLHPAQGGSFVFLDLRRLGDSAMPVLERAADQGVTLAPGELFGQGFQGFARLCYTATDLETLAEGLDVLATVLAAG